MTPNDAQGPERLPFGYFDAPDNLRVLVNMRGNLTPGGVAIVDVVAKEWLAASYSPSSCDEQDDGTLCVQRREVCDAWSRMRNEWILIREGQARSFRLDHAIYSGQELAWLLREAGFGEVALYGDLEGGEFGVGCRRLVVVARPKPLRIAMRSAAPRFNSSRRRSKISTLASTDIPTVSTKPARPGRVTAALKVIISAKINSRLTAKARQATIPAKRYQTRMNTRTAANEIPMANLPFLIVSSPRTAPI